MELHWSDVSAGAILTLSPSLCKVLAIYHLAASSLYAENTVCIWVFQYEYINIASIVYVCVFDSLVRELLM